MASAVCSFVITVGAFNWFDWISCYYCSHVYTKAMVDICVYISSLSEMYSNVPCVLFLSKKLNIYNDCNLCIRGSVKFSIKSLWCILCYDWIFIVFLIALSRHNDLILKYFRVNITYCCWYQCPIHFYYFIYRAFLKNLIKL